MPPPVRPATSPDGTEKRRAPRADLHILVQFRFNTFEEFLAEYSLDISVGGCSLKCDVRPSIGEFVLIAQIAGRVARHHEHGIGIEFVGQEKTQAASADVAHRLNIVK